MITVAAADLGASSGRVVVGDVRPDSLSIRELHRFANRPVRISGRLHWDILALYSGVLQGLRAAGPVDGIGIDSWAVDYGLLDADGRLLSNPVHYRDSRTDGSSAALTALIEPERCYRVTGVQSMSINTINQLLVARDEPAFSQARRLLLIPDLLAYWLSGVQVAERTNASTTGLLDATSGRWSAPLLDALNLDAAMFPALVDPGSQIGELCREQTGLDATAPVIAVGSHDTASAVVGVPARDDEFAYISCGTWALAGVELSAPVLTDASRAANFTNEGGVDSTVRYLRNVMGLWLLQESLATWARRGEPAELCPLLAAAADSPPLRSVIDPDRSEFLAPGNMPDRIAAACREAGEPEPVDAAALVRCICDSLALAFRATIRRAAELSGRRVRVVHIVGGGARNELLCQLSADAIGLPVVAGPVEAAALGNVAVQARALGGISGGLPEMRSLIARTQHTRVFTPSGDDGRWERAAARL